MKGVAVDSSVGRVDVRNVIGRRWRGMRYDGDSVRSVPSRVRGSSFEGVRISLVLAASTGARTSADKEEAAVAMRTVAMGEIEDSMDASGMVDDDDANSTSCSAIPNIAAKKLLRNVSRVCDRML